jgi:DNA/RNA-binding domain of Phe-tRNA-synthetase-like protein
VRHCAVGRWVAVHIDDSGEVIFADERGQVHARRSCNRQSARSAVRHSTQRVFSY